MHRLLTGKLVQKVQDLDWALLKGSAIITAGTVLARVLGLAFWLVLAGVFSADDYGFIRYAISVAAVVAIGAQPFGQHVIARFVGKNKDDPARLNEVLSSCFFVLPLIFGATLLIAVPVLSLIGDSNIGIFVIFTGITLFYAYWGLSTGFLEPRRFTAAYLGSNLVQILLMYLFIRVFGIRSPTIALLVYGLSYLLPLALLLIFWPLPGHLQLRLVRRTRVRELVRFSIPIWISHACYTLSSTLDILLLARFVAPGLLGAYSLSKTLAMVFLFVPSGISTLLMPKVAASPGKTHRQALIRMLVFSLLLNGLLLAAYLPLAQPFTRRIFGADYLVALGVSVLLALYSVADGTHSLITAVFVGSGRPEVESVSRVMDLAVIAAGCWLLIPNFGLVGAAATMFAGKAMALLTYAVIMFTKLKIRNRRFWILSAEEQAEP